MSYATLTPTDISADSRWVLGHKVVDDGHFFISSELVVIRSDGLNPVQLTNSASLREFRPHFSPDATRIACIDDASGRLVLLDLVGVE